MLWNIIDVLMDCIGKLFISNGLILTHVAHMSFQTYLICRSQSLPGSGRRIRILGSEMKTVRSTVKMWESCLRTHDTYKQKCDVEQLHMVLKPNHL